MNAAQGTVGSDPVILATAGYDHTVRFWQAHSGICTRTVQHQDSVSLTAGPGDCRHREGRERPKGKRRDGGQRGGWRRGDLGGQGEPAVTPQTP